ncbi:MAG: DNRLRE domain-containing protein [Limisphaera sp.]
MKNSRFPYWRRRAHSAEWAQEVTVLLLAGLLRTAAAPAPDHGIVAANLHVEVHDFLNATNSITLSIPYAIGDFRLNPDLSNNGDYAVQIGPSRTDDVNGGILITSVRENGRDVGNFLYPGTNFATSHLDYHRPGTTNELGESIEGGYWIPISMVWPNANSTSVIEYDLDIAAAWFPYDRWIGGFARNATGANGGANNLFTGSPGLLPGTHFVDLGSGRARVDLTSLGIDARTDGVLLVVGAKNEDNYALSWVNPTNGTWILYSKDNGTDGASTEQDPLAFVFIPRTNTTVISGRFRGDGTILLHSGPTPPFTITPLEPGRWELKIPGHLPRFGVLLVSPEGGMPGNQDNIVTYQVNEAGDGWILESRDLPAPTAGPFVPPLETPGGGAEPVASFVFIPGPTPGITVRPTEGLVTSETGGQALFTIVLDTRPTADVTLRVASRNPSEGIVSPSLLTFTPENWNIPQTVIITGVDDPNRDGPTPYTIALDAVTSGDPDYHAFRAPEISVVNADDESGGFILAPAGGLVTTEAGGEATFTVRLGAEPTAPVTIQLASSNPSEGTVSPLSLRFDSANWNMDQTVTVLGRDESLDDGDVAYQILGQAHSTDPNYNNLTFHVSVLNQDNDVAGLNLVPSAAGFQVIEGRTNSFTVSLTSEPLTNVTLWLTSSDTAQGGSLVPSSLTFTPQNWSQPQTVWFIGTDDLMPDGHSTWRITNATTSADPTYAALPPATIPVTTLDNEPFLILPSGDLRYGIGQAGVGLDGRAIVSDTNATDYAGTILLIAITNATADDRLEIRNEGTGPGKISVSGPTLAHEGVPVATFEGGVGSSPLRITFNANANDRIAQTVLRCVTFRNLGADPSRHRRTVLVTLAHPDGGQATAETGILLSLVRVADFQEGTDHGYGVYTGASDTELHQAAPDTPWPMGRSADTNHPVLWIDYRDPDRANASHVLLRFDNIIGEGPGQIPPNAIVVMAELLLNVRDAGDGGPLYRMLIPWDEATVTWNSLGNGIQPDDVEARSVHESALGVPAVTGDTGIGVVSIGVTADVQAWVNGEPNYGWGIPSWNSEINPSWGNGTDGLAFSPSESPIPDHRPRLRVLWLPAETPSASFRQNVHGYTGTRDTRIRMIEPTNSASTATAVFIDWGVNPGNVYNPDQVLLRFDDIIGSQPGQVPPHARIEIAVLDLATVNGNGYGDGAQFFAMLKPWEDTDTWESLGDGIQTDGVEAAAHPTTTAGSPALNPNVCGGYMSFEVTSDVQAWVNGLRPNHGWALLPWENGSDGWGISMSESAAENQRPRLRVYYTAPQIPETLVLQTPSVSQGRILLRFRGRPNTSYHILRAPSVHGPWSVLATATAGQDGLAAFEDPEPLPEGAFYRIRQP